MIKGMIEDFVDDSGASRTAWHVVLGDRRLSMPVHSVRTGPRVEKRRVRIGRVAGTVSSTAKAQWMNTVPSSVAGLFNATFGCPETGGCDRDGDDTTPGRGEALALSACPVCSALIIRRTSLVPEG